MKRKLGEEKSTFLQMIKEENEKLRDILQSSNENRARAFDILERKNEFRQQMSEHQLLMIDPNSIDDLDSRAEIIFEQKALIEKRKQARMSSSTNNMFNMFRNFPDLKGSGSGIPPY
ncbi:hypothetical protein ACS0TY_006290 [Phlomoides rotata]